MNVIQKSFTTFIVITLIFYVSMLIEMRVIYLSPILLMLISFFTAPYCLFFGLPLIIYIHHRTSQTLIVYITGSFIASLPMLVYCLHIEDKFYTFTSFLAGILGGAAVYFANKASLNKLSKEASQSGVSSNIMRQEQSSEACGNTTCL